jgi:hypothetical protein
LINPKYGVAGTSGLAVEVMASPPPGAYDFKLAK